MAARPLPCNNSAVSPKPTAYPFFHIPNGPEQLTRLLTAVAARILVVVDVEEEPASGVASTRPIEINGPRLTMKPGSYAWPEQVLFLSRG